MLFFLAIRNITRNIKDRAVIVLLIAVITFIFFTGNSVIENVNRNIHSIYAESLTGDVVVQKSSDVTMNLFGANVPVIDDFFTIPVLPAYDIAMELIAAEPGIEGITSQVSGNAILDFLDVREPVLIAGVDAESYFRLFPGITLEEGRFLSAGEYGAMITTERAQKIEEKNGQRPQTGMPLMLTSGGTMGFKIREVPLVGIFSYQNPGQFMNEIIIADPQTVRVLNSIHVAGTAETDVTSLQLFDTDLDDIFGEAFAAADETHETGFSVDILQNYLIDSRADAEIQEAGGDWNFIILRLKKGFSSSAFIKELNEKLKPYGLTAVNWRIASGLSSILVLLVMALFNAGIFLVSVGGIIAIINILLISVFRRMREIGTLRAIGASDFCIRSLIYTENLFIAILAGLAGVLAGVVFMQFINGMELQISNDLLISMLNGRILRVEFPPYIAVTSFLAAVILGLAATIYPVEAAVRVNPVVAVQRG